ncbi:MAG: class I SAM-dependent methyltransferase [Thermodesulfobacteriota bacterium]|nr:class I SAM-dependent methyltransferase [Thermodesulfobacteriota bacterium]
MTWALFNDVAQRILSGDKWEQRSNLCRRLRQIALPPGSKAMDFGCGTGLFARVFVEEGFKYVGYDIDDRLIAYAARLYPSCRFTTSDEVLKREGPFDFIYANCCFHHIKDELLSIELERIKSLLADNGVFFVLDILRVENDRSPLHRLFMMFEQGEYVRTIEGYQDLVERHFLINGVDIERSHLFSIKHRLNPLYNDLAVFACSKY